MKREPIDYCPGCQEDRPLSAWHLAKGEKMPEKGPFFCRTCRKSGVAPENELVNQLDAPHRMMLRYMMTCDSVVEVAKKIGLSEEHVRSLIRGRGGKTAELVQAAWIRMLELEGLDLYTIARIGRTCLHAVEPKWNSKREDWDFFPDNHARIKMIQHLTRQHRVEPSQHGFKAKNMMVFINNNLAESGGKEPDREGTYTIDVPTKGVETDGGAVQRP